MAIAGKARRYGLHTDSSHRFERGVDATLQDRAIDRATQLIIDIAGGSAGPITVVSTKENIPKRSSVLLRRQKIEKILGINFTDEYIVDLFQRLGMTIQAEAEGWQVVPPAFDLI